MVEKLVAVLIVGAVLAGAFRRPVLADQNYSCNPGMCCSIYGICGTGIYCRDSCLSGPCTSPPAGGGGPDCLSVADIVTEDIFDGIINQLDASCPGKNFYSRCAFLDAVNSHPNFGQGSYAEYSKREVAAFFAHAAHETRGKASVTTISNI